VKAQEVLYRGFVDAADSTRKIVVALEENREVALQPAPEYADYKGGYGWGSLGTKPSNLAMAIVWHYYRDDPDRQNKANASWRLLLANVISAFPHTMRNWEITSAVIEDALEAQPKSAKA
jgi:hypothetical protein